jgi:hypothetical protein
LGRGHEVPVATTCPNCAWSYTLKDRFRGCKVRCPHCFHKFIVPYRDGKGLEVGRARRASQVKGVVLIVVAVLAVSALITLFLFWP